MYTNYSGLLVATFCFVCILFDIYIYIYIYIYISLKNICFLWGVLIKKHAQILAIRVGNDKKFPLHFTPVSGFCQKIQSSDKNIGLHTHTHTHTHIRTCVCVCVCVCVRVCMCD